MVESFDSFLIQIPREMRTNDCSINRSAYANSFATPLNVPSIEPSRSSKGGKRKRPNSYRPIVDPDQSTIGSPEKLKRLNGDTAPSPMVTVHTRVLQVSKSNESSSLSKSVTQNGYKECTQIEVSKVRKTSTLTSLAMVKMNKNQTVSSTKAVQGERELAANQTSNPKLTATTLSLMNERERQMTLSKFPIVWIPKIHVNSAGQAIEKSVTCKSKEAGKEKQKNGFDDINEHVTPIATDQNCIQPKIRNSHVNEIPIASEQLSAKTPSSVPAGIFMRISRRNSVRNRPKIIYRCDGCEYFSEVKDSYERHLLLHKSCMVATRNKQMCTPKLKMIMN